MKKLLLFFAITALILTSCDGYCTIKFMVINHTKSDIFIEMSDNGEQVILLPDDETTVYRLGGTCAPGEIPIDDYKSPDIEMLKANMNIDGVAVPNLIWTRKYWDFTNQKYVGTYKLFITEELIAELLSTEEQ